MEHNGDELIREAQAALAKSVVTTPEPEDARLLASRLDDVLDEIEEAAHRIAAYRLEALPNSALRLCEIIEASAGFIAQAVEHLGEAHSAERFRSEVAELEREADRLARSGIADLFLRERDPLLLLKLKEIYEILERTVDRCEDVTDVLESIAIKGK